MARDLKPPVLYRAAELFRDGQPFAKLPTCSGLAALRLAAFALGRPLMALLARLGRMRARRSKPVGEGPHG